MGQMRHDVVARPVKEGDFVQLTGWFGDVWSYVTYASTLREGETTQLISHVRRDGKGHVYRHKLDTMDVLGSKIRNSPGSLMHGMDDNRLRRVATTQELADLMTDGNPLIVALPAFKLLYGRAWRGGEIIGRVMPKSGDVELVDGTIVAFGSPASLATPSPLC